MTVRPVRVCDRLRLTFCEIRQVFDKRYKMNRVVRSRDDLADVGLFTVRLTRVGRRGGSLGIDQRTLAHHPRTEGCPFGVREARSKVRYVA